MKNIPIFALPQLLLLAGLFFSGSVLAIDGDMDYTAPYIMVDPATGKVVTVNPGPRPKAHPDMGEDDQQKTGADVLVESPANAGDVMETTSTATASTTPAIIALWGALFYVIAGYLLARRTKIHNISTTSRNGNH